VAAPARRDVRPAPIAGGDASGGGRRRNRTRDGAAQGRRRLCPLPPRRPLSAGLSSPLPDQSFASGARTRARRTSTVPPARSPIPITLRPATSPPVNGSEVVPVGLWVAATAGAGTGSPVDPPVPPTSVGGAAHEPPAALVGHCAWAAVAGRTSAAPVVRSAATASLNFTAMLPRSRWHPATLSGRPPELYRLNRGLSTVPCAQLSPNWLTADSLTP